MSLALLVWLNFVGPVLLAQEQSPPQQEDPKPVAENRPTEPPSMMGAGMGPGMGGIKAPPGYSLTWYPSQSLSSQAGDLGLVRQQLGLGMPLWRDGGDMLLGTLNVRGTLFQTDALLPDSLQSFPDQLWAVNMGLNYMHRFDCGWSGGLMTSFGSASDRPFNSLREFNANIGAFVRIPAHNDRDSWLLGVMYMYGGALDFPLPMVAYLWNPSEQLQVNIGVPFSVKWKPSDDWRLSLSYMPLNNIRADVTHLLGEGWSVFGGYEFLNESYFLADRTEDRERFFVFEQKFYLGTRYDTEGFGTLEATTGYSLGRRFGQGVSQWGSLSDRVDVNPGYFLGVGWRMRF
jgi:hypothetical protein